MDFYSLVPEGSDDNKIIRTIEWDMMDKTKFFPLSMLSSFSVRCALYPLTLIKTRLQIQKHNDLYTGIFDAYGKIYRYEGFSGLYRGFWVSSVQIVSGVFYISTYEGVRHILHKKKVHSSLRALIAGGCASLVGQTIIVPFDVLSQHLMMMGVNGREEKAFNHLGIKIQSNKSKFALTIDVMKHIFKMDGIAGFYRGYWASLSAYVPNSALWWGFYHFYQDQLFYVLPSWFSHLLLQSISGTLGGFTTTVLTNPLDVVRARLQVQRIGSMRTAFRDLWVEEGLNMFTKGLSARLIQSATFSFSIIVGYETIKRISVNEEYKQFVKW
ncbi:solute carrier family 25 member 44 [Diorhabda carinulata]|uniref:solute carrier family 25 member 44 n=1 Tax=Diorhabda sublineata TaxID=1163346 RepID=UPI0024E12865|nr:solute carrier family 25 member 44 [Diorhabda sublineata]XP_056632064.1 solute carrier family 25 member 44 [Diorhabda sublineata]XP_056632065.1 solute carrier family 25 member 44 [Diorhabda sublineata]XP_056632066.1 solute carrier family 25 member 44 [Diorhabda sublineata]XP_057671494.1 solute carrier family 25 member 44 [Diorhabda carinulata]XP_057671495.1 solute carrier family 25 member 44 [Diorhabda carinulata]